MSSNNFSDIGERINSIVQDAVNSMDFDKLNSNIRSTVNGAIDEVHKQLRQGQGNAPNNRHVDRKYDNRQRPHREYVNTNRRDSRQPNSEVIKRTNKNFIISRSPAGRVSGVLCIVFGSIGMGVTALLALIFILAGSFIGVPTVSLIFLLSFLLYAQGISLRRRLRRFRGYVRKINGRSFCSIKELTFGSGHSEKYVIKDLKQMIRKGMFIEGHIDEQQTHLMLNYDVYQQYLKAQSELERRKREELTQENKVNTLTEEAHADEHIKQVVLEGKEYIRQIREANDAILAEEVSDKLFRLETVIKRIFGYIESHPEQIEEIRKFTEYYLPTTLKLVNTYKDLDSQSIQAIQKENITTAKTEIEKTLDTINLAFENLYDSLFVDIAMDVTTDISVLETMLKREGLTEKDFKNL